MRINIFTVCYIHFNFKYIYCLELLFLNFTGLQ